MSTSVADGNSLVIGERTSVEYGRNVGKSVEINVLGVAMRQSRS